MPLATLLSSLETVGRARVYKRQLLSKTLTHFRHIRFQGAISTHLRRLRPNVAAAIDGRSRSERHHVFVSSYLPRSQSAPVGFYRQMHKVRAVHLWLRAEGNHAFQNRTIACPGVDSSKRKADSCSAFATPGHLYQPKSSKSITPPDVMRGEKYSIAAFVPW